MKATALQQTIRDGGYDAVFAGLYGKGRVETQRARYARLLDGFLAVYGDREAALFSVPGRTEVSGNHTDHQHGRVLAAAVDIDIIAAASPTDEGVVRLKSEGYPEDVTDIRRPDAKACRRGTSSAAFEVMLGNILSHFYNEGRVPAVELAKSGKYAENEFFGKPCGLMDQAACAVGGFAYMDFASAAEPEIEKLSLELGGRMLCIVNTGVLCVAARAARNLRRPCRAARNSLFCGKRAGICAARLHSGGRYGGLSLARAGIGRLVVQVLTEYLYG